MSIEDCDDYEICKVALIEWYWTEGKNIYKFEATVKYPSETSEKKLKKIFYLDIPEEMSLHDMYDSIKKMAKEGVIEDVKLSSQRRSQSET